jgi:hypothetical protein
MSREWHLKRDRPVRKQLTQGGLTRDFPSKKCGLGVEYLRTSPTHRGHVGHLNSLTVDHAGVCGKLQLKVARDNLRCR